MVEFEEIVILTGAGISAESGLGTFRDVDGLWTKYDLNEVATPEGFARNPVLVHEFYNARRTNLLAARHNAAHTALAELERHWPGSVTVVTQNIDNLHEAAGSTRVIHMHGELLKALCQTCGGRTECRHDLSLDTKCSACGKSKGMRPDVVWFGEIPYHMEIIYEILHRCDLFISIGTSGSVYPAAAFVEEVRRCGGRTVELNLEPSEVAESFDEVRHGPAGLIVPEFVNELLARQSRRHQ